MDLSTQLGVQTNLILIKRIVLLGYHLYSLKRLVFLTRLAVQNMASERERERKRE